LTEDVDPEWSQATEERLSAIWTGNVTGIPSSYLFVMCKTTLCQINYRFPPGTDEDGINRPIGQFIQGFRASDLASELHRVCTHYSGMTVAMEYERNFPQTGPQPTQQTRRPCSPLEKRGP
jgi:hypothetical protein